MRSMYVCVALGLSLVACGDDDGGGENGGGAANRPWDPETCSPMAQTLPADCTQSDFDEFGECYATACSDMLETCYGPGFRSGDYSGPCEEFIECATGCRCSDTDCTAGCAGAAECGACIGANVCGQECEIPECTYGGAFDEAGVDSSKTCEDLRRCCAALDSTTGQLCNSYVNNPTVLGPQPDLTCAVFFKTFGSTSNAPECR